MNRMLQYCVLLIMASCGAFSQGRGPMTDTSSTYSDMWFDDENVYVYGSTSGSVSIHMYRVGLWIQTPSGTFVQNYPGYASGSVNNYISVPWAAADLNADFIGSSHHQYYCTVSGMTPTLAFLQLRKRPPAPNYSCTNGLTNVCADASNGDIPIGTRKSLQCKKWNFCCDATNQYYTGWCRIETCNRVPGQNRDPVLSQCYGETTCKDARIK